MALVPYTVTALAESDAEGTDGKNIVAGAVVTLTDTNGNAANMYDDEAGSSPSTAKVTGSNGQVIIYIEEGEYTLSVNGSESKIITGKKRLSTTQDLIQSTRPYRVGDSVTTLGFSIAGDGGDAQWIKTGVTGLTASQTPAQLGDSKLTDANGHAWELVQSNGQIIAKQLGAVDQQDTDDSAIYQAAINGCEKSVLIVGSPQLAGLTIPADKAIYGALKGDCKVKHLASSNQDFLTVSDPTALNQHFQAKGFTVEVEGEARSAIRLPKSAQAFSNQFTFEIDINTNLFDLGADGYIEAFRVGDCGKGYIGGEHRAGYIPSNDDTGQYDSSTILMDAVSGCIGVNIDIMSVNTRRPIRIGENVENFWLDQSELVNCWIGVDEEATSSKPGGYFGSGLHINANYRCINLNGRRDFNIGMVQCYRSDTYFDHGTGWRGLDISNAVRFTIGNCTYRNVLTGSGDAPAEFTSCSQFTAEKQTVGDSTGMAKGFILNSCDGFSGLGAAFPSGMGSWYELTSCTNYDIDKHQSVGDFPVSPYVITTDGGSGSIDRTGATGQKYARTDFSSAQTINLTIQEIEKKIRYSLSAGSGAYIVDVVLPTSAQLEGDEFDFFVEFATSGLNPTIRFLDDATVIYTLQAPGSISDYIVGLVYNGAGWVKNGIIEV